MSLPSTPMNMSDKETSLPAELTATLTPPSTSKRKFPAKSASTRRHHKMKALTNARGCKRLPSLPSTPTKASRNSTTSVPKRNSPAKSAEEWRQRVIKALKTNPDGASVLDLADIEGSYHRTAGYLKISVKELQKIIHPAQNQSGDEALMPKDVAGWIARFISVRDVLRTPKAEQNFSVQMKTIKWFLEKEELGDVLGKLFNDETAGLPLPKLPPAYLPLDKASIYFKVENSKDEARKTHIRWAHLNVLFVVYQILRLLPSRCVTGALSPDFDNARKTLGFHPEDWTRGLCLLKYATKELKSKVSHRHPPTDPEFFSSKDKTASTYTSFSMLPSDVEEPLSLDSDDEWIDYEPGVPSDSRTDEERDTFLEQAVKAMHTAMKSRSSSIKVSDQQRENVLTALYKKYGRKGIQFPEQQGEGPLAYFNCSEEQNDDEAKKSFYELQAALNKTTARSRTIEEACKALRFPSDATRWCVKNSAQILKSHQVLSLDWALQMITTLGFAYISSDVGMGKTAVAAALVLKLLEKRKAEQVGQASGSSRFRPTYKPTLVLIPRDGMLSLFDDLKAFPDITAHQWYGPPETAIADRAIGTSVRALIARLNGFSQYDPVTALQVVVTTYTKYRTMATYFEDAPGVYNTKGKGKAVNLSTHADEFDEEEEDDEMDTEEHDGKYQNLMCHVKGRFGLIILDQAHKVKNPLTRTHVSISKSCPDQLLGLTSTPIMQSPADLLGYIKLAWQVAASRELVAETSVHPSRNSYDPLAERLTDASMTDLPALLPILHPASFKTHLGYSTSHRELVSSVEHAQQIVRPIMRFCFLRFYKGQDLSPFGLNEVAGGEIPRYKSLVMEMQYDDCQQREHDKAFKALIKDRVIGSNDPFHDGWNEHGHVHPAVHKELVQLASNCYQGRILKKLGSIKAEDVNQLKDRHDSGFRFLFRAIVGRFPVYNTGHERAEFIASFHPKWGFLAGVLHEVLYKRESKLLVFVSSPFTHQILDNFLRCLGIQYVSINSAVDMDNRDKAYKSFNDPEHATSVMTVNTNLGCAAFQAQRACHITVLLDFPAFPSPRLFDQLIGRTWRMGQEHSPIFITVTSNATFDHILQGVFAHKAILQTAVLGNIPTKRESAAESGNADGDQNEAAQNLADGHTEAEEHQDEHEEEHREEQMEGEVDTDDAARKDTDSFIAKATTLYMKALGLSSSRMGWDRASCEQLLRARKRAKVSRADSVMDPDAEGETGRSESRPLVVDGDDDSSSSEDMCQDVDERLGEDPPAAEATRRRKRAASREPENPAKRQAMEGEASSSK